MITLRGRCGVKGESSGVGLLIVLAIIALFIAHSLMTCSSGASTSTVGSDVFLKSSDGSGDVLLCTNDAACDELVKLAVAKDYLGMAQMEIGGRLFRVPSGTKARVIEIGLEKREVRIMQGDHIGQSGWVNSSLAQ